MTAYHAGPNSELAQRIQRVLEHISANLDRDLTVDELARLCGVSKFHFQRQFAAHTGVTVSRLIRLMRLRNASYQLAFNPGYRVIDIALDAGFTSPEAFCRAFKQSYGQAPSEFRKHPHWSNWSELRHPVFTQEHPPMNVEIIELPPIRVAVLEHRGSPQTLMASVSRFIEWRKSSGLSPNQASGTYGIPYSDPDDTPPDAWHFDICGSVQADVPENPHGVVTKTIPGGRHAVAEHHGSTDAISTTTLRLYSEWLPASGETLRDFPCFFKYVRRAPLVTEQAQLTLVHLPLR